jgi:hypothetical protein
VKAIRYIFLNPVGIAIAFVHWMVVLFAMFGDTTAPRYGFNLPQSQTDLWQYLVFLNLPAVLFTNLISELIIYLFSLGDWANFVYLVAAIGSVTVQWLLVGGFFHFVISERNKEERRPNNITDDSFVR